MAFGSVAMMDFLWYNALTAVPLVLVVAAICKLVPCRPSTRHFLWLLVLVILVAPRFAPPQKLSDMVSSGLAWADRVGAGPEAVTASHTELHQDPDLPVAREVGGDSAGTASEGELRAEVDIQPPLRRRAAAGRARSGKQSGAQPAIPTGLENGRERSAYLPGLGLMRVALRTPIPARRDTRPSAQHIPRTSDRQIVSRRTNGTQEPQPQAPCPIERTVPSQVNDVRIGEIDVPVGEVARTVESNQTVFGGIPNWGAGLAETGPIGEAALTETDSGKNSLDGVVAVVTIVRRFVAEQAARWSAQRSAWSERLARLRAAIVGLPPLPTNLWLGGVVLLLAVMLHRIGRLRGLLRQAVPVPHRAYGEVLRAASEIGLKSVPRVVMVRQRVSPMIVCGPRPRLVLPVKLWSQLDRMSRHAVLCHELAHLKRRDHWVSWIEWIIGVVYWWNPLVWWIRQKLHEEAELCCDQWVTWLLPRERRTYAVALLKAKEYVSRNSSVAPAMSMGATTQTTRRLVRRIKMVMTGTAKPKLSIVGTAFACTLVLLAWMAGPAWGCPPKANKAEKVRVAVAPCAKCDDKCKCKCNNSTCKGQCCSLCKSKGKSAPAAVLSRPPQPTVVLPRSPEQANDPVTTFERYLSGQKAHKAKQGKTKFRKAPKQSAKKNATNSLWFYTVPQVAPYAIVSGEGDEDEGAQDRFERRVRRLERQIERLAERFERMAEGRGRGNHRGPPPIALSPFALPGSGGPTVTRSYELPKGKLKPLTQLMIRQDVPVLVSPHDDHIDVQGTERQQAIFKAFVDMIHPDGRSSAEALIWEEHSLASEALARRLALEGEAGTAEIRARLLEQRAHEFQDRSQQLENRAEELQDAAESLHEEMKQRALEQAATLSNQAQILEEQAESAEREAEELRARAEELTARSESLVHFLDVLQEQGQLPGSEAWRLTETLWEGLTAGVPVAVDPLEIQPVLVPEQPDQESLPEPAEVGPEK